MRKTISANNGFSFHKNSSENDRFNGGSYPIDSQFRNNSNITGSTPALHNNHNNLGNNNNKNIKYNVGNSSPAYYYSSTLDTPRSQHPPNKKFEQFHTKTTTLKSNKDPSDNRTMDYKVPNNSMPPASNGAAFNRRYSASATHESQNRLNATQRPINYNIPAQHIPAYKVEHLASFAVGKQFGLISPTDGVKKLKQMERNSAICPVPMLFTLYPDRVAVLEENWTLVEEFPLALVTDPTAHVSSDPDDFFNNVLLFIVKEHDMPSSSTGIVPTEMHIFQCIGVSAQELAEDLHHYTRGHFHKVQPGKRSGINVPSHPYESDNNIQYPNPPVNSPRGQFRDDVSVESNGTEYFELEVNTLNRCFDDIERFVARIQSAAIAQRELEFQQKNSKKGSKKDLRTAHLAQNGILQLRAQIPSYGEFVEIFQKFKLCFNLLAKLKNHIHEPSAPELLHFLFTPLMVILDACQWGLGQQVAQQVYSPLLSLEACELLRTFLYPKELNVWMALGKAWNTSPEDWLGPLPPPYRPVFIDGFAPYGYPSQPNQVPPTQWEGHPNNGPPPQLLGAHHPQRPPRYNSAPAPIHRGISAPPAQSSMHPPNFYGFGRSPPATQSASTANLTTRIENIELERMNLEKERLEFERRKVLDKEKELLEQERRLRQEAERLKQERQHLHRESEKHSIAESDRPDFYRGVHSIHDSPHLDRRIGSVQILTNGNNKTQSSVDSNTPVSSPTMPSITTTLNQSLVEQNSPRQKAFLNELARRGCKVVQVTYDRNACNSKELTVSRGEYLEVLNDSRNWWECRNVHSRSGFVPHTILTVLSLDDFSDLERGFGIFNEPYAAPTNKKHRQIISSEMPSLGGEVQSAMMPSKAGNSHHHASGPPSSGSSTPDLIRQRRGPKGEFRYF